MNYRKNHGGNLILIELMIALFFFAVSGAVLLQVFVKAHQISTSAEEQTQAWNLSTRAAERIEGGEYKEEDLREEFPGLCGESGVYECYFDKNWNSVSDEKRGSYSMKITIHREKRMIEGDIKVVKGKDILYQLDVTSYQPERRGHEET